MTSQNGIRGQKEHTSSIWSFFISMNRIHSWLGDLLQSKHLTLGGINFNVTSREDETIHRYNMCYLDYPGQSSLYKKDLNACVCY